MIVGSKIRFKVCYLPLIVVLKSWISLVAWDP